MKKTNLNEIIITLTELVSSLKDKKVKNFGDDLHKPVSQLIDSYLKQFGLIYDIWNVGQIYPGHNKCLFTLCIPDFIEDKADSHAGRVKSIFFKLSENIELETELINEDTILEEIYILIEKKRFDDSVKYQKKNIENLKIRLEYAEKDLTKCIAQGH